MKFIKLTLLASICALMINAIQAQTSGTITYQETMKLEIDLGDAPEGVDLAGMLPTSRSATKQLIFDKNESLYVDSGDAPEDTEISSDDGSIQIMIVEDDVENKLYTDHENNVCLSQQGFMGKAFIVNQPVSKIKWKITPEKVKYLDYECMKATMTDDEGVQTVLGSPRLSP